uniref:E3 ubiquitin-protein ligase TRIM39-like n=1 Tax=Pelusios castaneus TaxID=367368 RepID=A0A8C8RPC4_9SAUR
MSAADEVTCSICLEVFKDPVTTLCGHSFCQGCINPSWREGESDFCCPQCRETFPQKNLRPNKELRKRVELRLRSQAVGKLEGEGLCERHQEALKLFCEEDQIPVCLVCRESRDHRTHTVLPIEEAAKDYQVGRESLLRCRRAPQWWETYQCKLEPQIPFPLEPKEFSAAGIGCYILRGPGSVTPFASSDRSTPNGKKSHLKKFLQ